MKYPHFDVVIIGGGINGLCTAYQLSKHSHLKVALVEQFCVGNYFASSHGSSRNIRSTYVHPTFTRFMERARKIEWPLLEKEANKKFIYSNPGCMFGSGKFFHQYFESVSRHCPEFEMISISEAKKKFPYFTFHEADGCALDPTTGVIDSQEVIHCLLSLIKDKVTIFEYTKVMGIESSQDPILVHTNKEILSSDKIVVTTGPWISQLIPQLKKLVVPVSQTVGYFRLKGDQSKYQLGQFPNIYISLTKKGKHQLFWGFPEFKSDGIKVGFNRVKQKGDNPDQIHAPLSLKEILALQEHIQEQFVDEIDHFVHGENCFYTNCQNDRFILDFMPNDQRIIIGSACSGHAFKFGPLTGLVLAELAIFGKTTVPEFETDFFSMKNL